MSGCLYGVGLGPGDPELMTLKAARILREAKLIAYFSKRGGGGHARSIASSILNDHHEELPLLYPVTTEFPVSDERYHKPMTEFYETSAARIAARLDNHEDVAVLCEGDPFLYGSFMHLYRRLSDHYSCKVVPGISSMSGCWTNANTPIAWGNDVLTVLPATLDDAALAMQLATTDAAVVMKVGRHLPRVRSALEKAGLIDRAIYIEYATMDKQRIIPMREKTDDAAPYFSVIIIPGQGRQL